MEGHGIIYHCYTPTPALPQKTRAEGKAFAAPNYLMNIAKGMALGAVILFAFSYLPSLWYAISQPTTRAVSNLLSQQITQPDKSFSLIDKTFQPRFDPKITKENRLKIPAIGVDTQIQEATAGNFEEALKKGPWRVSDFGTPAERAAPTILAAHRYGYLAWTNTFRRKNSFYNLPKLEKGDTVEVYWKQRRYIYEVYAQDKGDTITDYQADLILYTCEVLNSPVRIFSYARLLEV
jgi:sortase (surface protein transpeptidase)